MQKTFKVQLQQDIDCVEEILKGVLPQKTSLQKTIFEAMEYSVMGGGKRIRPVMMLESYRLFGGKAPETVAPFMAAQEMIHTYSLVHDDLPAMDNDDLRRGRKTTHVVYGEDMGILAGDALLNYAYETVADALVRAEDKQAAARAFQILATKAGVYGMVGGQVVDVQKTGQVLDEETLEFIYRLKTGALLEASLMAGAALAGADETQLQQMERIGYLVGMAFQIQDDILDVTSTTQELGKPVGSDDRNEKTTYVTLYGMEAAGAAVEEYSREAMQLLEELPGDRTFLREMITMLIHRKK